MVCILLSSTYFLLRNFAAGFFPICTSPIIPFILFNPRATIIQKAIDKINILLSEFAFTIRKKDYTTARFIKTQTSIYRIQQYFFMGRICLSKERAAAIYKERDPLNRGTFAYAARKNRQAFIFPIYLAPCFTQDCSHAM